LHGWIVALTVTVEPKYAKLAGEEVIDLNFVAKSEEPTARRPRLKKYRSQPYVDCTAPRRSPGAWTDQTGSLIPPTYVPRGAGLPTGQYL
jgi:hypothetical protein